MYHYENDNKIAEKWVIQDIRLDGWPVAADRTAEMSEEEIRERLEYERQHDPDAIIAMGVHHTELREKFEGDAEWQKRKQARLEEYRRLEAKRQKPRKRRS